MSLCPNCHTKDKEFFAPKCHACNTPVGFIEQCLHSLLWTVTQVATVIGVIWLLIAIF